VLFFGVIDNDTDTESDRVQDKIGLHAFLIIL